MKLVTFRTGDESPRVGAVSGANVIDLTGASEGTDDAQFFASMIALIEGGRPALEAAHKLVDPGNLEHSIPLDRITLLAPIPRTPKNVMCVGLNYQDHIEEGNRARSEWRPPQEVPVFFTKPHTSISAPDSEIPYPVVTEKLDYEAELGVVMTGPVSNIARENALDYVFGYTVINDVTARDLQRLHNQWFKGKGLDKLCPMGPWIVTADEIGDPQQLTVESRVNGEVRQHANTANMIFDVATIISALSGGLTLEAGDVIATGTPSGVGMGFDPPRFLQPGDSVEIEVSNIGVLRNTIGPKA